MLGSDNQTLASLCGMGNVCVRMCVCERDDAYVVLYYEVLN